MDGETLLTQNVSQIENSSSPAWGCSRDSFWIPVLSSVCVCVCVCRLEMHVYIHHPGREMTFTQVEGIIFIYILISS